ncbi:hypothetical protein MTQ01_21625 [Streptomyces sp. XM4193]|uniref:hypothetical protein n=1 Tax=Streptomyces sp. XM4193 TaxID=2929782 RepID=UPI001FFBF30B|nr:hypothetical protein [Streptomyces sp. XM4193]MCK1798578.1 hypothetical protein [Streptomyces sp. XM4193]
MILTFFGVAWWFVGTVTLEGPIRVGVLAVGLALAAALIVLAVRRLGTDGEKEAYERAYRTLVWSNIAQGFGIMAVIVLGNVTGQQGFIPALIAIVVGVHFFPLSRAFGHPEYRGVAVMLIAVGVVGGVAAVAGLSVSGVLTLVGLLAAGALWATTVRHLLVDAAARSSLRQQGAEAAS